VVAEPVGCMELPMFSWSFGEKEEMLKKPTTGLLASFGDYNTGMIVSITK
jgi:hypothetical protein